MNRFLAGATVGCMAGTFVGLGVTAIAILYQDEGLWNIAYPATAYGVLITALVVAVLKLTDWWAKRAILMLLVTATMACATDPDPAPRPGRQAKSPGEVAQEQVQREGERMVRSTTNQILRAPGRHLQRGINCMLRGGC